MKKNVTLAYGIICYLLGAGPYFGYQIGFLGNFIVPKSIDSGSGGPFLSALLVNLGLIALFGVPHSLMARRSFKRWWTRIVPPAAERSTYMLQAGLLLLFLMWQWRPMPGVIWHVENAAGQAVIWTVFGLSWLIAFISTFLINHFELTGLQQVYAYWRGQKPTPPHFRTPLFYKVVRHPMQLGLLLGVWVTPRMTVGHLVFAVGMSLYVLIGLYFEERDLVRRFGQTYLAYRQRTPMLLPLPRRGKAPGKAVFTGAGSKA